MVWVWLRLVGFGNWLQPGIELELILFIELIHTPDCFQSRKKKISKSEKRTRKCNYYFLVGNSGAKSRRCSSFISVIFAP
jgi:hypothetical protein